MLVYDELIFIKVLVQPKLFPEIQPYCWIKMTILLCMRRLVSRSKSFWSPNCGTLRKGYEFS